MSTILTFKKTNFAIIRAYICIQTLAMTFQAVRTDTTLPLNANNDHEMKINIGKRFSHLKIKSI